MQKQPFFAMNSLKKKEKSFDLGQSKHQLSVRFFPPTAFQQIIFGIIEE